MPGQLWSGLGKREGRAHRNEFFGAKLIDRLAIELRRIELSGSIFLPLTETRFALALGSASHRKVHRRDCRKRKVMIQVRME